MPSRLLLETHGRADLVNAIYRRFGGLRPLARRMRLSMRGRNVERRWSSFSVVRDELRHYIAVNGTAGRMPTGLELRRHGRFDLIAAISRHGGLRAVGERCHLVPAAGAAQEPQGPNWEDFEVLRAELLAYIRANGTAGMMPTASALIADGRRALLAAMHAHHGGQRAVASRLGLHSPARGRAAAGSAKPRGYWTSVANLRSELLAFAIAAASAHGDGAEPRMPTQAELLAAGRADLHRAITVHHGGYFSAGALVRLPRADGRVRRDWASLGTVASELEAFCRENGTVGEMPSHLQLQACGRSDLLNAMHRHHGSMHLVAEQLGLRVRPGYAFRDWLEFENLAREIRAFLATAEGADPAVMPTSFELRRAGRYDLHCAVQLHAGFFNVARRMGLYCDGGYDPKPGGAASSATGAWRRPEPGAGRRESEQADDDEGAAGEQAAQRAERELMTVLLRQQRREEHELSGSRGCAPSESDPTIPSSADDGAGDTHRLGTRQHD